MVTTQMVLSATLAAYVPHRDSLPRGRHVEMSRNKCYNSNNYYCDDDNDDQPQEFNRPVPDPVKPVVYP